MEKIIKNINVLNPGKELYIKVRAGFVAQDTTLNTWCREHGYHHGNARHALIGSWDGPKGRALRVELLDASGVTGPSSAAA